MNPQLRQEFDERAPSSDDAKVALIFVRSSKELGYHDFVEPDDEMMSAVDWLQGMIADSKTESMAAKALTLETARKRDAGQSVTLEAAAAKYFASEMVGRVADRAVQIFGGAGYVADYGIERFYRDVRIFRIYEGTSQIQQVVIARETLKRGG